jgi:hypothetical protein
MNHIPGFDHIGRNIHLRLVDDEVVMPHELTCLVPRIGKPQAIDRIVQSSLQKGKKNFSGNAFSPVCLKEGISKLILEKTIHPFDFLFLPQLGSIRRKLRTLLRVTSFAFEKKLQVLSPANSTNRFCIPRQR